MNILGIDSVFTALDGSLISNPMNMPGMRSEKEGPAPSFAAGPSFLKFLLLTHKRDSVHHRLCDQLRCILRTANQYTMNGIGV